MMRTETTLNLPHDLAAYRLYRTWEPKIACDLEQRVRRGGCREYRLSFTCPWGCRERNGRPKRHGHGWGPDPFGWIGGRTSHCRQPGAPGHYVVVPADELEQWEWMDAHGGPDAWTECAQCNRVFEKTRVLAVLIAGRELHFCGQECAARMARDLLQEAMPPEKVR